MKIDVEQVTDRLAGHGEGPAWDAATGRLHWVDMMAGDMLSLAPGDGAVTRTPVSSVVCAIRPRRGGGLVLAVERGFALLDPGSSAPRILPEVWSDETVRMNDGGCDPRGRFYCGSMATDERPGGGALYRLDPDLSVTVVLEGVSISNGLAWTRDGGTAYYVDSGTQRIDLFTVDGAGELVDRRPFVTVPAEVGTPDGLCLDAEGGVWVALWDGAAVHRYDADGELAAVIPMPVARPTACAFGGPSLDELYITTSRQGPDDPEPSGALFRARPGVTGFADYRFAG
ncbi:SMP-30/gluconolactonase/LRE family protein [Asanoa sp. WMMD1127]|uniref:SMP-30/gluconolactonase/LRE family protein n=1 Tax=Asanoa sp. WMMD1127 TaxID=3016107 RepID=UPI00241810A9|nr:SMP-30/gluconolactonase/LRE family protein [Asanoa sp. WMMD1127]MDG4825759.1 SMP-30/gluconolactonase/LRE family protein [Asanoa sp. WMMD1127]